MYDVYDIRKAKVAGVSTFNIERKLVLGLFRAMSEMSVISVMSVKPKKFEKSRVLLKLLDDLEYC